jgi:hypothetical protein
MPFQMLVSKKLQARNTRFRNYHTVDFLFSMKVPAEIFVLLCAKDEKLRILHQFYAQISSPSRN